MPRAYPLFFLLAASLSADSLADLKAQLSKLQGQSPVKASVDFQLWRKTTEDKKPVIQQGRVTANVEDGPQGLRLQWSRPLLQQAAQEAKAQALDPEKTAGIRSAMRNLGPLELGENLNYAEALLRDLEQYQAQLLEEKQDTFHGQAAKLLVLKVNPRMKEKDRKAMKDLQVAFKLWLGQDGLPLGCTSSVKFKGSKFFISFEGGNSEEIRFTRYGDRLVATSVVHESNGSGFGQSQQEKTTLALTLN